MLDGTMTKGEAQAALNDIDLVAGIFNSIDENLPQGAKLEAFNLINEKRRLLIEIEGKDPALSKKSNDRIAEINTKLEELPSKVQEMNLAYRGADIEDALKQGRGKSKTVRIDGKRVLREEAEAELETIITKLEENAIQKQAASEVLIQPTTEIGEEVVQGEPTTESQGLTEEGKAQKVEYDERTTKEINNQKELLESVILSEKQYLEGKNNKTSRFHKFINKVTGTTYDKYLKEQQRNLELLNTDPLAFFNEELAKEIKYVKKYPTENNNIAYYEDVINNFKTKEKAPVTQEIKVEDIESKRIETEAKIKRKGLFLEKRDESGNRLVDKNTKSGYSESVGEMISQSDVAPVPTSVTERNGIEFVEFSNPKTGVVDVIVTGKSDNDFVGFYRIYENGKATNKWSSKFENQSRNKEDFKTMISGVQSMLPQEHEYTEKTSISTDGLRVWYQQLIKGYELQYDNKGKLITNKVNINGDSIINDLGIAVNKGNFDNISVTNSSDMKKVKKALLPYLEKFGLNESNINFVNGTVEIDLPVLKKSAIKTETTTATQESVSEEATPQPDNLTMRERMSLEAKGGKGKTTRVPKAPKVEAPVVEAAPIVVAPTINDIATEQSEVNNVRTLGGRYYVPKKVYEEAYKNDTGNRGGQTVDDIIFRGGYSVRELDNLLPNWKELTVELNKPQAPPVVTAPVDNLKRGDAITPDKYGDLKKGDKVFIVEEDGKFILVTVKGVSRFSDGRVKYVSFDEDVLRFADENHVAVTGGIYEAKAETPKAEAPVDTKEKIEIDRRAELEGLSYSGYQLKQETEGVEEWQREQAKEFNKDVRKGLENIVKLNESLLEEEIIKADNDDATIKYLTRVINMAKEELILYDEIKAKYDARLSSLNETKPDGDNNTSQPAVVTAPVVEAKADIDISEGEAVSVHTPRKLFKDRLGRIKENQDGKRRAGYSGGVVEGYIVTLNSDKFNENDDQGRPINVGAEVYLNKEEVREIKRIEAKRNNGMITSSQKDEALQQVYRDAFKRALDTYEIVEDAEFETEVKDRRSKYNANLKAEAPVVEAPVVETKEGAPTTFSWSKIKEEKSDVIRSMRQLQFTKLNPLLELKKPSAAQIIEIKALQAKIKSADAVLNARENKIKEDEKKAEKGEPTDKSPRVSGVDQNGKPAEFVVVVNEKKQTAKVQLKKRGDSELARQKIESDLKIQTDDKGKRFVETQNKSRVYIDEKVTPPKAEVKAKVKAEASVVEAKKEFIIDGKEYTEEEAIEISQNNYRIPNYGSKMEYNGSDPQAKEFVNSYNRDSSPYNRNGDLKGGYMQEKISEALGSMNFRKFGNLYRKHINPYFSREANEKSQGGRVGKNFSFRELAGYIIGDANPSYFEEAPFRAFAKEAGIDIPAAPVTEVKVEAPKVEPVVEVKASPVEAEMPKEIKEAIAEERLFLESMIEDGAVGFDKDLKLLNSNPYKYADEKNKKYSKKDKNGKFLYPEMRNKYLNFYLTLRGRAEAKAPVTEVKVEAPKVEPIVEPKAEPVKKPTVTAEDRMNVITSIKGDIEAINKEIKEIKEEARREVNKIELKILETKNENQKEELQFDIVDIETQLEEDLEGLKDDLDRQIGMLKEEVESLKKLDLEKPENKKTLLSYIDGAIATLNSLNKLTYAKLDAGVTLGTLKLILQGIRAGVVAGKGFNTAVRDMANKYKNEHDNKKITIAEFVKEINDYLDSTYVDPQTYKEALDKEIDKFAEIKNAVKQAQSKSIELRKKASNTIKDMLKGKFKSISAVHMKSIMTRLVNVKVENQTQYDKFLDYVDKVIEITNYDTKVKEANAKRKNAKKNTIGNNPKLGDLSLDLLGSLSRMLNINAKLISKEVFDSYYEIVDDLSKRTTILSPGERADLNIKVNEIVDSIEQNEEMLPDLKDAYDNFADKVVENGVVNYAKTLTKMLEDGVINNKEFTLMKKYKSKIVDAKVKVKMTPAEEAAEKAELINEITNTPITLDAIVGDEFRLERELAKRLARLVTKESLENLDNKQLKDLIKIIDNINNGFVSKSTQQMVEKLNENQKAPLLEKSIPKSVKGIFKKISQPLTGLFTRDKYGTNITPLFNIDEVFGDFKTKNIFNSVFEQSALSQQQYQSEISEVQGKLVKAESAIASSFKRNENKVVLSKFKMMVYMMQLEHDSNPNSQKGDKKQVHQAMETLDATIKFAETNRKKSRYTKQDIDQMKAIKEEFEKDGEIDIDKLYNSFNSAEKNALKVFDEVNSLMTKKATYTATVINGNKIVPLNNYIYYNTISDPSTSAEQAENLINNINNNMQPGTESKNLQERSGLVSPVNLDPFFAVNSSAKSVLINYHMTEPIRTARKTLSNARKILEKNKEEKIDVGEQFEILSVIEEAYDTATRDLLERNFSESSATLEYLTKAGYRAMLGSATRAAAELTSNAAFVTINNPKDMAAGWKYFKLAHSGKGKNILTNLKSKVTSRNYPQGGLTSNYVDLSSFTDRTTRNGKSRTKYVNGVKQVYDYTAGTWVNFVETVADNLISRPDQAVMKQLYFGAFSREFKKETGIEPDFEKIEANDEEYMDKYKDALEKATNYADNQTVTAGSSMNAYMGTLQNVVRKGDSGLTAALKTFNQFMNRFTIQEFITARRGAFAAIGRGDMTPAEGRQVLAAVTARMTLYLTCGRVFSQALIYLAQGVFGYGDDDDDEGFFDFILDGKTPLQMLYQGAVSTITGLFFGRNYGNVVRSVENYLIEQANKEYGEDIGLRNKEYDPFKDAVQFNQFGKVDELSDFAAIMSGPLGPVINAGTLAIKLANKEAPKEERTIETRRKEWYRLGIEAAGSVGLVPFYRDVRKVTMDWVYEELKKELKEDAAKKVIKDEKDATTLEKTTNTLNRMKVIYKDERSRSIIDDELRKLSDPDFKKQETDKEDAEEKRLLDKYGYDTQGDFERNNKEKYKKVFGADSPYRKKLATKTKILKELNDRMNADKDNKTYKSTGSYSTPLTPEEEYNKRVKESLGNKEYNKKIKKSSEDRGGSYGGSGFGGSGYGGSGYGGSGYGGSGY